MQALILAGGLGTRLRSLIPDQPKALAPIHGRPFLDYQLAYLKGEGVEEVILCAGHLGQQVAAYADSGERFGLRIHYVQEHTPLGTAGAVRYALEAQPLTDHFLVLNGDTYIQWSLARLRARHEAAEAMLTLVLTPSPNPATASVEVAADGRVRRYAEKVAAETVEGTAYASAGVYLIQRAVVEQWSPGPLSLERDCLPQLVSGGRVYGEVTDSHLYDIGTPAGLSRFEQVVWFGEIGSEFLASG
jgi:NDP-sugar pyrophosphorylase family protein